MLDFRIATFLQLCETRSYTKTAKLLDITQPSVTQHIKYLQKKYNCKLFSYEGKTLHLTPEGEYFRRQAEAMTKMSAKVISDLHRMSEQRNELHFGCPRELGERNAAAIVTGLLAKERPHRIVLETGNTEELLKKLENGQLDVVLCDKQCALPQMASAPAVKAHFGCYASPDYAASSPTLKRALARTLLLREEGAADRAVLGQLLHKRALTFSDFDSVVTSNSAAALQDMAAAGIGVVFGYASAMEREDLAPLNLADLTEERPLVFLFRKDGLDTEGYKAFFESFRTAWAEQNAAG